MAPRSTTLDVDGLRVTVERKRIKHLYVKVSREDGSVRISAPQRADDRVIRAAVAAKIGWIRKKRRVWAARPSSPTREHDKLSDDQYRAELATRVPELIARWEPVIGRRVAEWRIRKMKTRWGSCNPVARRIWLSLELAKKPPECLEYVVVHEMAHLIEANHSKRFYALMDRFMPDWRERKERLESV